jgi:hypothetical protein
LLLADGIAAPLALDIETERPINEMEFFMHLTKLMTSLEG